MKRIILGAAPLVAAAFLAIGAGQSFAQTSGPEGSQAAPQIGASPTPLYMEIGPRPASGAITLFNYGKKDLTAQATVHNFDLDDNNRVRIIPPGPQSLDLWMIVSPLTFTIPAGKSQTVRISVRPPVKPAPGEHRAIVFFTQKQDDSIKTAAVNFLFQVGVAVYGMAEGSVKDGVMNGIEAVPGNGFADLAFDVSSVGNASVRIMGQYAVWPKDKFAETAANRLYTLSGPSRNVPEDVLAADMIPDFPVLPGTRRVIACRASMPSAPGEYVIHVSGVLGAKQFQKSFPVSVPKDK